MLKIHIGAIHHLRVRSLAQGIHRAGHILMVAGVDLAQDILKIRGFALFLQLAQAALGAEIDVPTLGGTTKYNIPAGTQEGTSFRIRGEGIQQFRGTNRGDMFFTVHVEVPKHLGEKQKELLRQFEDSLNGREYERRKSFGDQVKSYIRDNAERFKEKFEKK